MGEGEVHEFSHAVGRFEAGIETLTNAIDKISDKLTTVITSVHSHGQRLDKIEPKLDTLHEHHTGKSAVWKFLRAIYYALIGGGAGWITTTVPWAKMFGPLIR